MNIKTPIHDDHVHLRAHIEPPLPHDLKSVLKASEAKGIIPGIREHPPLPKKFRIGPLGDFYYAMAESEVDRFISLFVEAGWPLGLEVDYFDGEEDETKCILDEITAKAVEAGLEISGIHGSLHHLPGDIKRIEYFKEDLRMMMWDLDESVFITRIKENGPKNILQDYFGAMTALVELGIFDTLSHIELIRKFDRKNQAGDSIYFSDSEDVYDRLIRRLIEKISETKMVVEINMAGLFAPLGRPYITQELLKYVVELDIPVSIGSDSHIPERVGSHLELALEMLVSAGSSKVATFKNRAIILKDIM